MNKISVTLYDVVGYAIPGFVGLMSLAWFISLLFETTAFLSMLHKLNIVWQIGISYIFGHLIQASTSIVWKNNYSKLLDETGLSDEIVDNFKNSFCSKNKIQLDNFNHYELSVAENEITCGTASDKINTFRAFQGLYKGIAGVAAIICIELVILVLNSDSYKLTYDSTCISIARTHLIVATILFLILFGISIKRHNDFIKSRLRTIISTYHFIETE